MPRNAFSNFNVLRLPALLLYRFPFVRPCRFRHFSPSREAASFYHFRRLISLPALPFYRVYHFRALPVFAALQLDGW